LLPVPTLHSRGHSTASNSPSSSVNSPKGKGKASPKLPGRTLIRLLLPFPYQARHRVVQPVGSDRSRHRPYQSSKGCNSVPSFYYRGIHRYAFR
jgi:hypothetical protein